MKSNAGKPLVVESDDAQRERIVTVLRDAGYKVSTEYRDGVRSVLAFDRDVLILGADPPKLDCCDLVSALKGSEPAQGIRVIMLTPGGSPERTRGLDLGGDDVLSVSFGPPELLAGVRFQLQDKLSNDDLRERARIAEQNRSATQQVVTAVRFCCDLFGSRAVPFNIGSKTGV